MTQRTIHHKPMPDIETSVTNDRRRLIVALTWPALAENLLSTLVSMADTMMVAALGTLAVNAVGLVTQPRFIVLSAFMALGIGSTSLVALATVSVFHLGLMGVWIALVSDAVVCYLLARRRWFTEKWALIQV